MPLRLDAILERRLGHRPAATKWVKYSAASLSGVVTSQVVLIFCVVVLDIVAEWANVIAVTAGAVPNYMINRAWTFNKRGTHSVTREVLPFWGMAFLGLLLSTLAVGWADDAFGGNPLALSAANIGAFGVLWVAKYFVLDKLLFAPLAELVEHHEDEGGHLHLHPVDHGDHGDRGEPAPDSPSDRAN